MPQYPAFKIFKALQNFTKHSFKPAMAGQDDYVPVPNYGPWSPASAVELGAAPAEHTSCVTHVFQAYKGLLRGFVAAAATLSRVERERERGRGRERGGREREREREQRERERATVRERERDCRSCSVVAPCCMR